MTIPSTRTIRLRIAESTNHGKLAALNTTTAAWDQAVCFYTTIFLEYPRVFEARTTREARNGPDSGNTREIAWTEKVPLTWAESVTVPTAAHPTIPPERNLEAVSAGCLTDLRRAAIAAASGAVPSYRSNLRRWEKAPPTQGSRSRNHRSHTPTGRRMVGWPRCIWVTIAMVSFA